MYGYRERIGLILPSTNTVMESELGLIKPEGVSVHTARVHLTATNPEGLRQMATNAERAASELKTCLCDVLVYSCTSGSFLSGETWETGLRERLTKEAEGPVLTATYACRLALEAFGKKNITIVTPYIDSLNQAATRYFESAGYNIVSQRGLGIETATEIGKNPPHIAYRLGKETVTKDTELLFLCCTGLRTIEVVAMLETDLGIPVISSNIACLWAAMRAHGLRDNLKGYGSLFAL